MFKLSSKIVFTLIALIFTGSIFELSAEEKQDGKAVRSIAEVNGQPIPYAAFQEELKESMMNSGHRELSPERVEEIKTEILNRLIGKELVRQEAKKANTAPEILIRNEVYDKSLVSEEEVRNYYQEHPLEFMMPKGIRLRHLLVRVDPSSSNEGWKAGYQKALELSDRAKQGEDFDRLIEKFSDPEARYFGGDLKIQYQGQMAVAEFEKSAFSLKQGEVSGPIQTLYGFSLIQVVEMIPQKPYRFEEINRELLKNRLSREKEVRRSDEWIKELRSQAIIKIDQN
jgi:parvulin-like peptidyl-prolyl isomerase